MRLLPFAEQWRQPGDLVCTNADFSALLQGIGSHALNEESALSLLYFLALTPNDSASQAERCKALLLARLDAVGDDAPDMRSAFQIDHVERLNAGPALFQPAGLRLLREVVPEEEESEPDGFAPFAHLDNKKRPSTVGWKAGSGIAQLYADRRQRWPCAIHVHHSSGLTAGREQP